MPLRIDCLDETAPYPRPLRLTLRCDSDHGLFPVEASIQRTSAGLRDALFDAIEKVRDGDMVADDAKAIAGLAGQICNTVELEIEVAKLRADPNLQQPLEPVPLVLGAPEGGKQ